jgi:hypothetical protein
MDKLSFERWRIWTGTMARAALFLALGGAPAAYAHQGTAPWLDESTLDQGLYVEVRHPRVIRNPRAFEVSVLVNNLLGSERVAIRGVRYSLPGRVEPVARARNHALPTKRTAYRRYKTLLRQMERAGQRSDAAGVERMRKESHSLLLDMTKDTFRDRQFVDRASIPEIGKVMKLTVEVDVAQRRGVRTISRTVDIPVEPLLPSGPDGSWFAGDQHLHTAYSIDAFFLEGTVDAVTQYATTAQALGLDWIIITDHTNVNFLIWYQPYLFEAGENMAQAYRTQNDYLVLQGEEMGVGAHGLLGAPAHLLVYPRAADSTGFLPNPCSGLAGALGCEPEQVVIDRVNENGGLSFIAHPFDSQEPFYAPWNQNSGAVGWAGIEIFNADVGPLADPDVQAIAWWNQKLNEIPPPQGGQLALRPDYPTRFPVGLGNSDAHHITKIGNTFSYARLPGVTQGSMVPREALMNAFIEGAVVASNGPLAYAEIAGASTGEVAAVGPGPTPVTLTLETTPEFGPVSDYVLAVFVNGTLRRVIQPDGATGFQRTVVVDEAFSPPDKFVTVASQRFQCGGCPLNRFDSVSLANPIWLEFANPATLSKPSTR